MSESHTLTSPRPSRRRMLLKGESLVALLGIGAAAILVITMAAGAWWSSRSQRLAAESARREHVGVMAAFLAQSAESMIRANELSNLRRLIVDTRRTSEFSVCRVSLPDGRIIADGDPAKINLAVLPPRWDTGPVDAREIAADDSLISINQPLLISGRGPAILQIAAATGVRNLGDWETAAGAGLIGIAGLLALLLVYRQMRSRVVTLGMIRDSLLALERGERASETLSVAANGQPEVSAWNKLLNEAESLRQQSLADQARGFVDRRRESRSEMELACDSLAVGLILLDERGSVKHANGAAASLLRRGGNELTGVEAASLFEDAEIKKSIMDLVRSGGKRRSHEVSSGENLQASVLRVTVRPLRREDNAAVLITIEDVTQQRVAEESRRSFVAQATHELRTPLTNMRLCLEVAADDTSNDPAVREKCFNQLNQETRRLERIVTEILSVSEIEAGSLKIRRDDVRLDALFEGLKTDLELLANEKQMTLKFELPPKLPVIQADRDKLLLALHNLIANAIKYTPAGGTVTVSVKADAKQVSVDVSDTGIGIGPDEQELIFEKFYRSKDPRVAKITGSGLGLALTREVARFHGGDVVVHSELDHGSTFTLTVPALGQAA